MPQPPTCRDYRNTLRGLCVFNFAKRRDTIVADRGINFAVQKGLETSHSTVRCFDHNDLKSLEDLFPSVVKEHRNVLGLLQDDSLSPRASLRRNAPWSIYQN
ncbi:hypothetical protein EDB89DRAFT_2228381 [Lactarius sanguifluus]|nr:hypothetical protein EDB89DRAFT_2228381 [Lactarius sanguifluus]